MRTNCLAYVLLPCFALVAGCDEDVNSPADEEVEAEDLTAAKPKDLSVKRDMAVKRDLAVAEEPDLLAAEEDLTVEGEDLAAPADLGVPTGDLTGVVADLAVPVDLAVRRDLATRPDLVIKGPLAITCGDDATTFYQVPPSLPPFDGTNRGDVLRCMPHSVITAAQLNGALARLGYRGPYLPSGATVYKIAFRTLRYSRWPSAIEGISSALVLIPDKPRVAGAQPLVVAAHGSVGVADRCGPSRGDLTAVGSFLDDARSMYLALVGYGWTVIAPDYSGFGFGQGHAWSLAEDEARALLDSTFAANKMLPAGSLGSEVVIVGHSQGGHAALAAQSYAGNYGLKGHLAGVATYAPLWFSAYAWGASLSPVVGLNTTDNAGAMAYALQYFYGHGELIDGPGGGLVNLKLAKQAAAENMLTTMCLDDLQDNMKTLGAKPSDIYNLSFTLDVGTCGALGTCVTPTALNWRARFRADRPAIDRYGAPMVIWAGGKDTAITPELTACGLDRIRHDLGTSPPASLTVCADSTAVHGAKIGESLDPTAAITRRAADWVNQWISARTLLTAEPPACPDERSLGGGTAPKCKTPPPNNDY